MLKKKHLVAGEWLDSSDKFANEPVSGELDLFAKGSIELVERAALAAEEAFWSYGYSRANVRAEFLREIANQIDLLGDAITAIGEKETGLPAERLVAERGRTTNQLKLFADHIEKGEYLDFRHDKALPDRLPVPRPDIKLVQRPIGPVVVFGASNFPLAFSTAGGDTAAALAAGCPVIVKGHSSHPGVSDLVAQAVSHAIDKLKLHPGVFSLIQGGDRTVGKACVEHPLIKAVGFTGSLQGGRALFDACAARPEPIPFFGELGSINPMFLLDMALNKHGNSIAKGWAASLTQGAGQFCTNPGVAIAVESKATTSFISTVKDELQVIDPQTMLTSGIASAFQSGRDSVSGTEGVQQILKNSCEVRSASPQLFVTTGDLWLQDENLREEVFGPLGVVVVAKDQNQVVEIAHALAGQLTCTVHLDEEDHPLTKELMPILERKAGRLLVNGFPTGVEVCDAMVHGGPYPASTNFGATAVGTLSIRRFLRPVSYQNVPVNLIDHAIRPGVT